MHICHLLLLRARAARQRRARPPLWSSSSRLRPGPPTRRAQTTPCRDLGLARFSSAPQTETLATRAEHGRRARRRRLRPRRAKPRPPRAPPCSPLLLRGRNRAVGLGIVVAVLVSPSAPAGFTARLRPPPTSSELSVAPHASRVTRRTSRTSSSLP